MGRKGREGEREGEKDRGRRRDFVRVCVSAHCVRVCARLLKSNHIDYFPFVGAFVYTLASAFGSQSDAEKVSSGLRERGAGGAGARARVRERKRQQGGAV